MAATAFHTKEEGFEHSFLWQHNVSVQKLLDVVVRILVNEYVQAVNKDSTPFSANGNLK